MRKFHIYSESSLGQGPFWELGQGRKMEIVLLDGRLLDGRRRLSYSPHPVVRPTLGNEGPFLLLCLIFVQKSTSLSTFVASAVCVNIGPTRWHVSSVDPINADCTCPQMAWFGFVC